MSNLGELQGFIQQIMSDSAGVIYTGTNLVRQLNWAQNRIAEELECCEDTITSTALDNDAEFLSGGIALPVGFIRPVRVLWNGTALQEVSQENAFPLNDTTELTTSETPMGFYTTQQVRASATSSYRRMEFYPAQTKGQTGLNIVVVFKTLPEALSGSTDVSQLPPSLHEALAWRAIAQCKMQENDYEGYKLIMDNEYTPKILMAQSALSNGTADSFGGIRDVTTVYGAIDSGVW